MNRSNAALPILLALLPLLPALLSASAEQAEEALRLHQPEEAARVIDDSLPGAEPESAPYLAYLRVIAASEAGRPEEAAALAHTFAERFPESEWVHKIRFLEAAALIQLSRHREAEAILSREADRLVSEDRKQEIASLLIQLAEKLSQERDPAVIQSPEPDHSKALALYQKALSLEIRDDLRDTLLFRVVESLRKLGNHGEAIAAALTYLEAFDPGWSGPVGSPERLRSLPREVSPPAGKHRFEVRLRLAESQLANGERIAARQHLDDLLTLLQTGTPGPEEPRDLRASALLVRAETWDASSELDRHADALRRFLEQEPADHRAPETARRLALAFDSAGRIEEAIAAWRRFIAGESFRIDETEIHRNPATGFTPSEQVRHWQQEGLYRVGEILYSQRRYDEAISEWRGYLERHPNGSRWTDAQNGVINAEFEKALEAVAEGRDNEAREALQLFLTQHPLDARCPQILFTLGQMDYHRGEKLEEEGPASAEARDQAYEEAVRQWTRLAGKHPGSEEASLALYRSAVTLAEKLGRIEEGIPILRRLDFGSWAGPAQARLNLISEHSLDVATPRSFRTNEEPYIEVGARNLKAVTLRQYDLDLEAYFRREHELGRVEELDIDLIEPDRTWEVAFEDFEEYRLQKRRIPIPFEEGSAGVAIVRVEGEDWEATTVVVRSDLDLIVHSSRNEAIAYVENRLEQRPAENVRVLFSDGTRVFAEGVTGADGVVLQAFPEEVAPESLRLLALTGSHVASNRLDLSGLPVASGLVPRVYLHTDKPLYQPGETLHLRAVVRTVRDGAFAIPDRRDFDWSLTDSEGRSLQGGSLTLSDMGSAAQAIELPPNAPAGAYTIQFVAADASLRQVASFQVRPFALQSIQLDYSFDRAVYFRGETVTAAIAARYSWGTPAARQEIHYTLPDGREFTEKTDEEGLLQITMDTTGFQPGQPLVFRAALPTLNVRATGSVFLADVGYTILAETDRPVALAEEPFQLRLTTLAADGKPLGADLTVQIMRRTEAPSNPVLEAVPWIGNRAVPIHEVTVEERKLSTDPGTGKASLALSYAEGGTYLIQISGKDRFNQSVSARTILRVSDNADENKLRFLSERDEFPVGSTASLLLHSRLERAHALVTFEGDRIIGHRIVELQPGSNPIEFAIEHGHFPNFQVSVAAMDGRSLRSVSRACTATRELRVEILGAAGSREPGEEAEFTLQATDQLGRPVAAEFSVALVNDVLYRLEREVRGPIREFFDDGARRRAAFRTESSCGFSYGGISRRLVETPNSSIRLFAACDNGLEQLLVIQQQELALNPTNSALFADFNFNYSSIFNTGRVFEGQASSQQGAQAQTAGAAYGLAQSIESAVPIQFNSFPGSPALPRGSEPSLLFANSSVLAVDTRFGSPPPEATAPSGEAPSDSPRYESASVWLDAVQTGEDGSAQVRLTLPETAGRWRVTAVGCTTDTLAGETSVDVITRREFFGELRLPVQLQEGDLMEFIAVLHNLSDRAGEALATLRVEGGQELFRSTRTIPLEPGATAEIVFDAYRIPFAEALRCTLTLESGDARDESTRTVPIRPWGLEYSSVSSGITASLGSADLELPADQAFTRRRLLVGISPSVEQSLIDLALGTPSRVVPLRNSRVLCGLPTITQTTGSALLGSVHALTYARARGANPRDVAALTRRVHSLISAVLLAQQEDGGWSWNQLGSGSEPVSTSIALWALTACHEAGFPSAHNAMERAAEWLRLYYPSIPANDHEQKALLLFAQSFSGEPDFSAANRLYRERASLTPPARAFLAAAFVRMKRDAFARDLLELLASQREPDPAVPGCARWAGSKDHALLQDPALTTAVILWTYAQAAPTSPVAKASASYLLAQLSGYRQPPGHVPGFVVAALTAYHGTHAAAREDFRVILTVNDREVHRIESNAIDGTIFFSLPAEWIEAGVNRIRVAVEGRGEIRYDALLTGFSADLKDPESWDTPHITQRHYFHDRLSYRDLPLQARSTSPVSRLRLGQRVRVAVHTANRSHYPNPLLWEEPLPAGMLLVPGSVEGNFDRLEEEQGILRLHYRPGEIQTLGYELVAHAPGAFRVLPSTLRDATDRSRMRIGSAAELQIFPPGSNPQEEYRMNANERFELAGHLFRDGKYEDSRAHLDALFADAQGRRNFERDIARMLLWIHTEPADFQPARVVEMFEILHERYPDLVIPFDRILRVGEAYRELGEFERAWLVFRATIESSFLNDANISAVLEDQGQYLGSIAYQERLWKEYPDHAESVAAFFALSQSLFEKAPRADALPLEPGQERPNREDLLKRSQRFLERFLAYYPSDPLADDAAFSLINVGFALENYSGVVASTERFAALFTGSPFLTSFRYMAALGHFWQRHYAEALAAAVPVAEGDGKDRDYARYITAQIHHAQGNAEEAIRWYEMVHGLYPDAAQSIAYFQKRSLALPEVSTFRPGEPVQLELEYRNIQEAVLRVYRVDLMKLYLREKNLSRVSEVSLAGIDPDAEMTLSLGDGRDFRPMTHEFELPVSEDGAYLVLCRGDDLFASGLVLVSPLRLEVHEDAASASLRVNVLDVAADNYAAGAEIKAIGSVSGSMVEGVTGPRGVFQAEDIRGLSTVIARHGTSRYAFFRGKETLGPQQENAPNSAGNAEAAKQLEAGDYLKNIEGSNKMLQETNLKNWDLLRRNNDSGVKVQKTR